MRVPNVRDQGGISINMTPMIDIVFLLIIFFLVSSHLAKQENRMKLDLPSSTTAIEEDQNQPTSTINVDSQGQWLLGGHQVDRDLLQSSLAAKYQELQGNIGSEFEPIARCRMKRFLHCLAFVQT